MEEKEDLSNLEGLDPGPQLHSLYQDHYYSFSPRFLLGGLHSTMLPNSSAPGLILSIFLFIQWKNVNVPEVNQLHRLEEIGPWLEGVDLTHLVAVKL